MKNKKVYIITIITLTLIMTSLAIGMTLSSFSSKDITTNKLNIGEIQTAIIERDENGIEFKDEKEVTGGEQITKKVYVQNPSKTNSLVRVSITTRWVDPTDDSRVLPINDEDILLEFDSGINENVNANWYKGDDGYYYYKKILRGSGDADGRDTTELLLKSVKFKQEISDFYKDMVFKVDVKAESIETTRIQNSEGITVYKYNYMWTNIKDQNLHDLLRALVDSEYIND